MKLSIALATFNGEAYLGEQLRSLTSQTRLPDEIIVSDDESTDNTVKILHDFASHCNLPVKVTEGGRLGVIGNFERAIRACTGDIIFLCDQDDIWLPEKLARHESVYSADPEVGLVFSNATIVDDMLKNIGLTLFESFNVCANKQVDALGYYDKRYLYEWPRITGCTASFRSNYRDLLLPFATGMLHDEWLALVISTASKIVCLPEQLVQYRRHAGQVVGPLIPSSPPSRLVTRQSLLRHRGVCVAKLYERMANHAGEFGSRKLPEDALDTLADFVESFWCRAGYHPWLLKRLPRIAWEVLSGSYTRYPSLRAALMFDLNPKYFRMGMT